MSRSWRATRRSSRPRWPTVRCSSSIARSAATASRSFWPASSRSPGRARSTSAPWTCRCPRATGSRSCQRRRRSSRSTGLPDSTGGLRAGTLDPLGEAARWSRTAALAALALSACIASVDRVSPAAPPVQRPARSPRRAGADASSRPALEHPRLQETVLPSGLRLLLDEDPHATVAGAVTIVPGGSTADPPGAEGLAHLVEHLVYRAVDPPSPAVAGAAAGRRDITRRDALTHDAAVAMNAHTTPDCLLFYEFAPTSRLEDLLGLTIARMADPLVGVSEEAFALERRIIGAESRFREDSRRTAWAANELYPVLFPPPHPYARPT